MYRIDILESLPTLGHTENVLDVLADDVPTLQEATALANKEFWSMIEGPTIYDIGVFDKDTGKYVYYT